MLPAQRKAVSAHRRRNATKGLVRVELLAPAGEVERLKRIARMLREDAPGASALRALARDGRAARPLTGAAMIDALSVGGDVDFPEEALTRGRAPRDRARDVEF